MKITLVKDDRDGCYVLEIHDEYDGIKSAHFMKATTREGALKELRRALPREFRFKKEEI